MNKDSRACWIDTNGDFSIDRALRVLEGVHGGGGGGDSGRDALSSQRRTQVFDRLTVSRCFDVHSASETLNAIASNEALPRLVVIDSVTPLFREHLDGKSAQGEPLSSVPRLAERVLRMVHCRSRVDGCVYQAALGTGKVHHDSSHHPRKPLVCFLRR